MEKSEAILVAQLLYAMKEVTIKLEEAYSKKEVEKLEGLKKEIIELRRKIDKLI